jgi:hypothetical protein
LVELITEETLKRRVVSTGDLERLERDEADRWVLVWDSRILERNEGEGRGGFRSTRTGEAGTR